MPLTLISPAFAEGERLPEKYTRPDRNISPPLRWSGAPEGARGLALLMEDPDAPNGPFHHWLVYDIPVERTELTQSVETGPIAATSASRRTTSTTATMTDRSRL